MPKATLNVGGHFIPQELVNGIVSHMDPLTWRSFVTAFPEQRSPSAHENADAVLFLGATPEILQSGAVRIGAAKSAFVWVSLQMGRHLRVPLSRGDADPTTGVLKDFLVKLNFVFDELAITRVFGLPSHARANLLMCVLLKVRLLNGRSARLGPRVPLFEAGEKYDAGGWRELADAVTAASIVNERRWDWWVEAKIWDAKTGYTPSAVLLTMGEEWLFNPPRRVLQKRARAYQRVMDCCLHRHVVPPRGSLYPPATVKVLLFYSGHDSCVTQIDRPEEALETTATDLARRTNSSLTSFRVKKVALAILRARGEPARIFFSKSTLPPIVSALQEFK